jgi:primosomal protein N' (replication factor Y)
MRGIRPLSWELLYKAKVLLGSATPSIETYFNAVEGKFGLVELNERFGGVQTPEILCADLEKETKLKTMKSHFSSFLIEKMTETLENKQQIILFQNGEVIIRSGRVSCVLGLLNVKIVMYP